MHERLREAEMDEKEEIKSQERHHGDGKKEENEEHLDIEDLLTQCYFIPFFNLATLKQQFFYSVMRLAIIDFL